MKYESKTGRVRGEIFATIKAVAARRPVITIADVKSIYPGMTRQQASSNLHRMFRHGHLKRVRPGKGLWNRQSVPPLYAAANNGKARK
jgi:predicted transcriptional regulator of viral defense system